MVKDEVALQDILAFIAKDSIDMLCSGIQTSHGEQAAHGCVELLRGLDVSCEAGTPPYPVFC